MGNQVQINIAKKAVELTNSQLTHHIDIRLITDGKNHVIKLLDDDYRGIADVVVAEPPSPRHLGFSAQQYLASELSSEYDLYGYLEDDLVINDPLFFSKIHWMQHELKEKSLLLPNRYEQANVPSQVDKLYIDGPFAEKELKKIIPEPAIPIQTKQAGGIVRLESPLNPHAGCFFLTPSQLRLWIKQPHWQDGDCSFVSPLESAATLGIAKTFSLYKTSQSFSSWLEIQHWGTWFSNCLVNS